MSTRYFTRADLETRLMSPGRARLWRIGDALQHGEKLTDADAAFLAKAFKAIANGKEPAKALGSAIGKGRPPRANVGYRALEVADAVEALRDVKGRLPSDAYKTVGRKFHLSEGTVGRYHEKHGKAARLTLETIARMARDRDALKRMARAMTGPAEAMAAKLARERDALERLERGVRPAVIASPQAQAMADRMARERDTLERTMLAAFPKKPTPKAKRK